MSQYVAFLRAINVGGHVVKMDRLREIFQATGFTDVETFIASGNVLFDSGSRKVPALESKIELSLKKVLGYDVATFIRSPAELVAVLEHRPFAANVVDGQVIYVGFTNASPPKPVRESVAALSGRSLVHCRLRGRSERRRRADRR